MTDELFEEGENQHAEIHLISEWMKKVKEYGLEVEVFYWALSAMKNNPSLSIFQAFKEGYWEWMK